MAYFTTVLQRQVNDVWRRRIEEADAEMQLYKSGKEIRDYLNDHSTLNTAGFVIRRYLQKNNPKMLEGVRAATGCEYADLTENLNIKWPDDFNTELARILHKISKDRGINISRTTWISYLDDSPKKMYKDTPFKVAFALSMDVESTEELLMACGQDTYCFRNPEHFIFYYCQSRPSSFSWGHAQELIERYRSGLEKDIYTANDASRGMTNILRSDLKTLFSKTAPDAQTDNDLIQYMLDHQREFSGLSLTARNDFLRMARYLAVLYPTYSRISSAKNPITGEIDEVIEDAPVTILPDGSPKLSELVRALFSTGGWLPTTIGSYSQDDTEKVRTASSLKRRETSSNIEYRRAAIDEENDRPFLNSIQYFVDSYAHHLDAIDRVFRRPANPGNVERRDVILFTYFFIRRYPELLSDEDTYGKELDALTALVYDDEHIDPCMDYLMEELYNITSDEMEAEINGSYDEGSDTHDYIELFNEVLSRFGMKGMYMPNPWDRFITMSLFAEDPDFFTEAVLWNTISDEEDGEENEGTALKEEPAASETYTENLKEGLGQTEDLSKYKTPAGRKPYAVRVQYPQLSTSYRGEDGNIHFVMPVLQRRSTGESIIVGKSCFAVGRISAGASLQDYGFQTETKRISRCHAAILFSDNMFYLADISSSNETWLNGQKLLPSRLQLALNDPVYAENAYPLQDNDQIQIGDEAFIFRYNAFQPLYV